MSRFDPTHPGAVLIKLARYLITEADSKGLTHGEKHYLQQTALYLLHKAQCEVDQGSVSTLDRHEVKDLEASDIPF